VDPSEAAYSMVVELVEPYLEEIRRYQQLKMSPQAKYLCMGVLEGLYGFEHESLSPVKDWASDTFFGQAQDCLTKWLAGQPAAKQIQQMRQFVQERLPLWAATLLKAT
jgi:hypothetical protein